MMEDLWDPAVGDVPPTSPAVVPRTRLAVNADANAALDVAQAERLRLERRQHALEAHARESAQPSVPSNQCAICLGQMARTTKTVIEECFHSFCRECIATWCDKQASKATAGGQQAAGGDGDSVASCPLCREPIVALLHDIRSDTEFLRSDPKDVRAAAERAAAARRRRVSVETQRVLDEERFDPFGPRALARRRCATLPLSPLPLILSYKSEKSLCGAGRSTAASSTPSARTSGRASRCLRQRRPRCGSRLGAERPSCCAGCAGSWSLCLA